jgi:hypothetical protein
MIQQNEEFRKYLDSKSIGEEISTKKHSWQEMIKANSELGHFIWLFNEFLDRVRHYNYNLVNQWRYLLDIV